MTREERCELAIERGYIYDFETGYIYNRYGKISKSIQSKGYVQIAAGVNKKTFQILGHHFAWYCVYGNVDFKMLDHKNEIKTDNRIDNLRIANNSLNQLNTSSNKGYGFNKNKNLYNMQIILDGVKIQKYFKTTEEAQEAYLQLKKEHMEKHYGTN